MLFRRRRRRRRCHVFCCCRRKKKVTDECRARVPWFYISSINAKKKVQRIRCVAKEEEKKKMNKKIKPFIVCLGI